MSFFFQVLICTGSTPMLNSTSCLITSWQRPTPGSSFPFPCLSYMHPQPYLPPDYRFFPFYHLFLHIRKWNTFTYLKLRYCLPQSTYLCDKKIYLINISKLFFLQVPNLPLQIPLEGGVRTSSCLHQAKLLESNNLLPKGKSMKLFIIFITLLRVFQGIP